MPVKTGTWGLGWHEGAREGLGDYQVAEKVHRFRAYAEVSAAVAKRKT